MVIRQLCHTTYSVSSADDDDEQVYWPQNMSWEYEAIFVTDSSL